MELEQLRQLEAIEREGTMSAAAQVLHLSQPALSRSLGRLESELGQPLFDRAGRRLILNDAGRVALEHAGQILRAERVMREALADVARRTRALRVGTVAPAPLWRLTALMAERFPGLVLTSQMLAEDEVEAGVVDGDLDLGISLCPLTLPMVRSTRLMVENLAVVLPSEHVLAGRSSVSMAELDGETFLLFQRHRLLASGVRPESASLRVHRSGGPRCLRGTGAQLAAASLHHRRALLLGRCTRPGHRAHP